MKAEALARTLKWLDEQWTAAKNDAYEQERAAARAAHRGAKASVIERYGLRAVEAHSMAAGFKDLKERLGGKP